MRVGTARQSAVAAVLWDVILRQALLFFLFNGTQNPERCAGCDGGNVRGASLSRHPDFRCLAIRATLLNGHSMLQRTLGRSDIYVWELWEITRDPEFPV